MLRIRQLKFSYRATEVLKGVSLELNQGIGCLLGPNGAGKSTLLKCIAGILKPKEGEIVLGTTNTVGQSHKERAKRIAYSPQEFSINFPYTVFEVVLMGRNPHVGLNGPKQADEMKTLEALASLGIDSLKNTPFTSLSGGQKRLALIARALAQDGALFLFDEPTSFLDFKNQVAVLSIIRKISKGTERSTLLSLHDPNLALTFCDVVFMMKEGIITTHGEVGQVINEQNLYELYGLATKVITIGAEKVVVPDIQTVL
jgi:iron complex transport system ATP-binding protein